MPRRVLDDTELKIPPLSLFATQLKGTGKREISTTMAFVRMLSNLVRDKKIGKRVVPIVPDEARTFGMEGMFRQLGIYSSAGQLYEPEDSGEIAAYRESKDGQVLEEGINEAGAFSAWLSAATSYSSHKYTLIPFYIYYSMFGFQRIGDLAWAAGDIQARGFLLGGTAGRTTLNGEGLQHQDGHSHVLASTIPNCVSYDPTYAYELAVILHHGMKQMYEEKQRLFYYITVMNENYVHPEKPEGCDDGIIKGMYRVKVADGKSAQRVRLLGSGTILREVIAASELLAQTYAIDSEVWSVTSFNELRRDGLDVERWNMLHPDESPRQSYVAKCLGGDDAPVIASSDYIKSFADQIRPFVPADYRVLGTDGFGRSDTRKQLRSFFEVDHRYIAVAALSSLAERQIIPIRSVAEAIKQLDIEPDAPNPRKV